MLAGLAVADAVFHACDPGIQITWNKPDGAIVSEMEEFGAVRGNARAILRAERVALNFMQVRAGEPACPRTHRAGDHAQTLTPPFIAISVLSLLWGLLGVQLCVQLHMRPHRTLSARRTLDGALQASIWDSGQLLSCMKTLP